MSKTQKGFDLAEVLNDVSGLDTFSVDNREQIEYISIDLIISDPANFYELSGIDALAENIELIGLQQPLRVRQNPDDESSVIIVSGHRRMAALRKLVDDGRDDLRDVPCIVDKSTASAAMQELRLIYANSDTRVMKSADISKQVERIENLLYQLKEEGYEFPGRMRDHVAEVCKVSKTKIARLKMIRDNLHENWQPAYQEGKLNESVAYALSQLPVEDQLTIWASFTERGKDFRQIYEHSITRFSARFKQIADGAEKNSCVGGCKNIGQKRMKAVSVDNYMGIYCDRCCGRCPDLAKCKYSCPKCDTHKAQLKADARAQKQQEKTAEEERQRPLIQQVQDLWVRFGTARRDARKTVKECKEAVGCYYFASDDKTYEDREQCIEQMTPSTKLPYGYDVTLSDVSKFIKIAELLDVSLDYLFGRTPNPGMTDRSLSAESSGEDISSAVWYPASVEPPVGKRIIVLANDGFAEDAVYEGADRLGNHAVTDYSDVRLWTLVPSEDTQGAHALQVDAAEVPAWHPGTENPPEALDAVAYFAVDGMEPIRKLAHWDGRVWKFSKDGAAIDAQCLRWLPIPPDCA